MPHLSHPYHLRFNPAIGKYLFFFLVKAGPALSTRPSEQGGNYGASGQAEVCGWKLDLILPCS